MGDTDTKVLDTSIPQPKILGINKIGANKPHPLTIIIVN